MTEILVIPAETIRLPSQSAVWPLGEAHCLQDAVWREREPCETDESWLQLIPYVLLLNSDGEPWCYRRVGGDKRLQDRRSCGLGGHVERGDATDLVMQTLHRCARRELAEELADPEPVSGLQPRGWIYEGESAIGRVHLGVLFCGRWQASEPPGIAAGEPMESLGFKGLSTIVRGQRFELWSRLAADWLSRIPE